MNTRFLSLSGLLAAATATAITTVSAWAFVASSASFGSDPFQFASIMAANAKLRVVQVQSRTASTCPNNPEARDPLAPLCLGG